MKTNYEKVFEAFLTELNDIKARSYCELKTAYFDSFNNNGFYLKKSPNPFKRKITLDDAFNAFIQKVSCVVYTDEELFKKDYIDALKENNFVVRRKVKYASKK